MEIEKDEKIVFSGNILPEMKNDINKVLVTLLPDDYQYLIVDFEIVSRSEVVGETKFKTKFRVNISDKEEIDGFIVEFGNKSGTSYNKIRGDEKGKGVKVVVSGYRKCQHNVCRHGMVKNSAPHTGSGRQPGSVKVPGKNTSCLANLKFSLSGEKLHSSNRYKLSLTQMKKHKYPLEIKIDFIHNHSINAADARRYRPVSEECKKKFIELFQQDHSASSALNEYKKNLKDEHQGDTMALMADRSVMPDYMWVFHYHRKYIEATFGSLNGPDAFEKAEERVRRYNHEKGFVAAKLERTSNGEIIIAICDSFCRRVHKHVPQAGDIVLMDATSNLDRYDTKLFHLICPSPAGGLPLGNILTTKDDKVTIKAALVLFQSILPTDAFFGRGPTTGPKIIMTDDSDAERGAIRESWPEVILLLCIFHLLQALWRWLWSADHNILKNDRPECYNLFKRLVYAKSEEDFEEKRELLFKNKYILKYKNLKGHIKETLLPRKDEWSLAYRYKNKLTTHNVNTTNYAEVSFRLTKENQFNRVKAYNLPDLLDIILDDSIYYVNRCIDVGNNRTSQFQYQKSRYMPKNTTINVENIKHDTENNVYYTLSK